MSSFRVVAAFPSSAQHLRRQANATKQRAPPKGGWRRSADFHEKKKKRFPFFFSHEKQPTSSTPCRGGSNRLPKAPIEPNTYASLRKQCPPPFPPLESSQNKGFATTGACDSKGGAGDRTFSAAIGHSEQMHLRTPVSLTPRRSCERSEM